MNVSPYVLNFTVFQKDLKYPFKIKLVGQDNFCKKTKSTPGIDYWKESSEGPSLPQEGLSVDCVYSSNKNKRMGIP